MVKKQVTKRLWDYGLVWVCETNNLSVSSSLYADSCTPLEIITGDTPDISEHLDFSFYDWVTYRSNAGLGPIELGRWLGVSHKVGQLMSYWLFTSAGRIISCSTVQQLTYAEMKTDEYDRLCSQFNDDIERTFDVKNTELGRKYAQPLWNRLTIGDIETDDAFVE